MAIAPLIFVAEELIPDVVPVTAGDLGAFISQVNGRMVMDFPDGANEYAAVTPHVRMEGYAGGTLTATFDFFSTATANEHRIEVYVEAVTVGTDTTDLDAATSFDSLNVVDVTVSGTAGVPVRGSVVLTNKDSVADLDMVRFMVRRDADHANDDASGTFRLLNLVVKES